MSLDQVGIDIIIPIYNAFNDLVTCIDSVKAHTNLNCHRLILINDASTDSRIAPYLDSLSEENIMVLIKGFVYQTKMSYYSILTQL